MGRLLFILSISFGSIAVGFAVRTIMVARSDAADSSLRTLSRRLKLTAFFFLNPIALLSTFWAIDIPDPKVLAFPLLGLLSVTVGMACSLLVIRLLKAPPFRAGSIFTCGSFSNILTMGGLVAFALFREPGYALVQLFTLLMSPAYYMLGYPISANVGNGRKPIFKISGQSFKENPFLIIPITFIALGFGIRATGIERPDFLAGAVSVIVPFVAATLGVAIGLTLKFTGIQSYKKEIASVLVIRHLLVPLVMVPIGILMGFGSIGDGLALKVVIVVSMMPVAFNALVPPAVYGFDLDLANSAWIVSTAGLAVIVPALFGIFELLF